MKKICLVTLGYFLMILHSFSQTEEPADSTGYKSRKLKLDEINFVTSYYHQDGNNSAVTGGIGSEKLNDFSNVLDVQLSRYDNRKRKHQFTVEAGIDTYTSASSDQIDPKTISSASYSDVRFYPSLSWTVENEKKGTTYGLQASASTEFDYQSFGIGVNFIKKSKDRSRELSFGVHTYLDQVSMILPVELRQGNYYEEDDYPTSSRNSFSTSLSISQIINQRWQLMFLIDAVYQQGYLGLPFHRVYFNDNTLKVENLPSSRMKIPIGFRSNYFMGDHFIFRTYYRYYHDDWGINAHTADLEVVYKINPFFSVSPFYRYYTQTGTDYFAPFQQHQPGDKFYTSNFDLSGFHSGFAGIGVHFSPYNGVFGIQKWNTLEIRYGHYNRSNGLQSNIISLHVKIK